MCIVLIGFRLIFPLSLSNTFVLMWSVAFGITVYVAINWMINRGQLRELWDLIGLNRRKLHEGG